MRLSACLVVICLVGAAFTAAAAGPDDKVFYAVESMARGRHEQAVQALTDILAVDPDNAFAANRLALARAETGRIEEARQLLEKSLTANPANLTALWTLGCLDLAAELPEQAASRFAALRRAEAGNARGSLGLGLAAAMAGRRAEAVKLLAEAQAADSQDPLVRYCLGLAYWLLDAPVNARLELEAALELSPRFVPALNLLGLIYRGQGKTGLAKSAWEQALALNAADARARFYLSRLAQDEGLAALLDDRRDEARRAFVRALELDRSNEAAAVALTGLGPPAAAPKPGP